MVGMQPLFVARSDGVLQTKNPKTGKMESNGPSEDQMENSKDSSGNPDTYREVGIGDPKNLEWRRKLGGLLVTELLKMGPEKDHKAMKEKLKVPSNDVAQRVFLAAFPENYRLYEHKRTPKGESQSQRSVNGRRDFYLYGHPEGRKKRYRSPTEFYPHLMWLCTDATNDRENCSCKMCTPNDVIKAAEEMAAYQAQKFGTGNTTTAPTTLQKAQSLAIQTKDGGKGTATKQAITIPNQAATRPMSGVQVVIPRLAEIRSDPDPQVLLKSEFAAERELDAKPNKSIFRPGELVWYDKASAVGLAVIVSRNLVFQQPGSEGAEYSLQPLSHPFSYPPAVHKQDESKLKPWLAFTVPPYFHTYLRGKTVSYAEVNWRDVLTGKHGSGDAEADASMMAAKGINSSYTLIDPLPADPTTMKAMYGGIYLGCEKVWVGEAVRLKNLGGRSIMIVSMISDGAEGVKISGKVFSYQSGPVGQISAHPSLPVRVQDDLNYRNERSRKLGRASYWIPQGGQATVSLADITGRWYESRRLIPIILGQDNFAKQHNSGNVGDVGDSLNARGQSANGAMVRAPDRLAAFGKSIPATTKIHYISPDANPQRSSNAPKTNVPKATHMPAPAALNNAGNIGGGLVAAQANAGDISEFMDVDQMAHNHDYQGYIGDSINLGNGGQF